MLNILYLSDSSYFMIKSLDFARCAKFVVFIYYNVKFSFRTDTFMILESSFCVESLAYIRWRLLGVIASLICGHHHCGWLVS